MLRLLSLKQCKVLHHEKAIFALVSDFEKFQLGVGVDYQNLLSLLYLQFFAV